MRAVEFLKDLSQGDSYLRSQRVYTCTVVIPSSLPSKFRYDELKYLLERTKLGSPRVRMFFHTAGRCFISSVKRFHAQQ